MCTDKDKQKLSAYDIKGEEKTSSTSKKKDNARYDYVFMTKCG